MNAAIKINWFDKQIWRQNLSSTFICFISCSIGMALTTLFLITIFWAVQLVISILASFIISFVFILLWNILFNKTNYKMAKEISYHTSFISIIIMMTVSYLIMFLLQPNHSAHNMKIYFSNTLAIMLISMGIGFLVALPVNYYILHKTGKACHA